MGEYAEQFLSGMLCEECGEYLGDEAGHPRLCRSCRRGNYAEGRKTIGHGASVREKVKCPQCGRWLKETGLEDHFRTKHGE